MYYVSVLAIFKNETHILEEWIEHYLWQGVEHFYLIDNGSADNPLHILQKYIDQGLISYYYRPKKYAQYEHYREIYSYLKDETRWMIMADLDEFWYSEFSKISLLLPHYEKYDVIYTHWTFFGSSGLIEQPKSVRKSFIYKKTDLAQDHKYICQTKNIEPYQIFIHIVQHNKNVLFDNKYLKLNHYVIQSLNFFKENKMTRGDADNTTYEKKRTIEWFNNIDKDCTELDLTLSNIIRNKNILKILKEIDFDINSIINNINLSGNIYEIYFSTSKQEISYLLNELLYNNKHYIYGLDEINIDCIKCDIIDYDLINNCSTLIIHGIGDIYIDKITCKIIHI
jgi:hypothetical protein